MSETPTFPLGVLVTIIGGGTPSKRNKAYWEGGTIPWVSPKDMKVEVIRDSQDHITEAAVEESSTKLIPAGSVLVVTRSGILRHTFPVAVNTRDVTLNQDIKALVPKADILPAYLSRTLKGMERQILQECSKDGTTVNSIDTKKLAAIQIPLPTKAQQQKIVDRLDALHSELDAVEDAIKFVTARIEALRISATNQIMNVK